MCYFPTTKSRWQVFWFTWECAKLLPLTWSSCGSVCAQKGAMVHLIFPSGSISISHQERTTWAWPDARGSNCLLWQAAELLTCLLKSTLWKNIQELKCILSSHTPFLSFYGDLTSSETCLQWTPPAFSGRWHQLASFPLKKNFQRPQCHQVSQSAVTQLAPWYLNIGSTLLRAVKSVGEIWFSWMS